MILRLFLIFAAVFAFVACHQTAPIPKNPNILVAPLLSPEKAENRTQKTAAIPTVPKTEVKPGLISLIDLGKLFELKEKENALILDVRPAIFYVMSHIPGALSFPRKSFSHKFPELKNQLDAAVKTEKSIVLYCTDRDCPDAQAVANKLSSKGYAVSVYAGGWDEWKVSGL